MEKKPRYRMTPAMEQGFRVAREAIKRARQKREAAAQTTPTTLNSNLTPSKAKKPPYSDVPPPRKAASSPLAANALAKALDAVAKKSGDPSARLAASKMRSKYGNQSQSSSSFDADFVQAGIELAGYYIESGSRSFSSYSQKMIEDLGESAKPYLKAWYLAIRYWPGFDNTGMQTASEIEEEWGQL